MAVLPNADSEAEDEATEHVTQSPHVSGALLQQAMMETDEDQEADA